MKIAINSCYGGFGLSHAATMLYGQKKGLTLHPYVNFRTDQGTDFERYVPYNGQGNPFCIYYFTTPLMNGEWNDENYFSVTRPDNRTDPDLIAVIEELGDAASGRCAKLRIIEIPDGTNWQIQEYDGYESVHEVHQSWS